VHITKMRTPRAAMMKSSAGKPSETGGHPCNDHLVEHCRAVMCPQRRSTRKQEADCCNGYHNRSRI
jgi:hypothetical protein